MNQRHFIILSLIVLLFSLTSNNPQSQEYSQNEGVTPNAQDMNNQDDDDLLLDNPLDINLTEIYQKKISLIKPTISQPSRYIRIQLPDIDVDKIDLSELKSLIERATKAAKKARGKDLTFSIGKTGSGKTTLLYYLMGKKLKIITIQSQNNFKFPDQEISVDYDDQQDRYKGFIIAPKTQIPGLQVGHNKSSKTKVISIVQYDGMVFADTAGLMDTDGVTYDIANSIGFSKAFDVAKSVKFVLVISQNTIFQGRGKALRQLIQQFIGFTPNLDIDQLLKCTSAVITHIKTSKYYILQEIYKTANQTNENIKVKRFLHELYQRGRGLKTSKLNYVAFGTKTNMKNRELGKNWRFRIQQGQQIQNPKEILSVSLKKDSVSYILAKLIKINTIIKKLSDSFKFNQIKYFLQEIDFLAKNTKLQQVYQNFNKTKEDVNISMKRLMSESQKNIDLLMAEQGQISQQKLNEIEISLSQLTQASHLINGTYYQLDKSINLEQFVRYIQQKMNGIIEYVIRKIDNLNSMYSTLLKLQKFYFKFGDIMEIRGIYQGFCNKMAQYTKNQLLLIIQKTTQGNYTTVAEKIAFLQNIQGIYQRFFNLNISNITASLKTQIIYSLNYRIKNGFLPQLMKINVNNQKYINKQYNKLINTINNYKVIQFLGKKNIQNLLEGIFSSISQQINITAAFIKDKIKIKQFKELQQPLQKYKLLRSLNNQINANTVKQYYQIIQKFNGEILTDVVQFVDITLKKISYGYISQQQIFNLKQKIKHLQEMKWIDSILGNGRATQIYQKITLILEKKCKNLQQTLKAQIIGEINQLEQSSSKTTKFEGVNQALNFMKNVAQISENIETSYKKVKNEIQMIINARITDLQQIISKKNQTQMHKSQIDSFIINLYHMKNIRNLDSIDIEHNLKNCFHVINNFLNEINSNIIKIQIQQSQSMIKNVLIFFQLIKKIKSIDEIILKKYKLDLQTIKNSVQILLETKFSDFFDRIKDEMKNRNFFEVKKLLEYLKIYKNSLMNIKISSDLKEKLIEYKKQYQQQASGIPNQINKYLIDQKFHEFQHQLNLYKNQSQIKYKKYLNYLRRTIQTQYDNNIDEISKIDDNYKQFHSLHKKIKNFFQYSKIGHIVSIDLTKMKSDIILMLCDMHNKTYKSINKTISDYKFKDIKIKIDYFNKMNQFLKGLIPKNIQLHQNIRIQNICSQLQNNLSGDIQFGQFYQWFSKYDKLKQLDTQCQSQISKKVQKKLKDRIMYLFQKILQKCQKAKEPEMFEKVENCTKEFESFNKQIQQNIKSKIQFSILDEKIKKIQKNIQNIASTTIFQSIFNLAYLQSLMKNGGSQFKEKQQKLRQQFTKYDQKLLLILKQQNYDILYEQLLLMNKYEAVGKFIRTQKYNSFSDFKKNISRQIQNKNYNIFSNTIRILKDNGNLQQSQIIQIQKFMDLQLFSKGNISHAYLQKFHQSIVDYYKWKIPNLDKTATFESKLQKLQKLRAEPLLQRVKKYISNMQECCTIKDKSNIVEYMKLIPLPKQYDLQIKQQLKMIPIQINQLLKASNFNSISNRLAELKKIGIQYEANEILEKEKDKIKKMINETIQYIKTQMHGQNLTKVKEDIRKIMSAESQLKAILGLSYNKKDGIIAIIKAQAEKDIIPELQENLKNGDAQNLLKNIINLKAWADRLPILQKQIDSKISQTLTIAKTNKLTGQLVGKMQKNCEQETDTKIVAIIKDLMHKFSKQLSVPRTMPRLRMSIQSAISQFKTEGQDQKSREQLKKAYDIWNQQYESGKLKFISKGSSQLIKNHSMLIKKKIFQLKTQLLQISSSYKTIIPKMLGNIFLYWSLSKSGQSYYDAFKMNKTGDQYLLQPHPIQVLSILRFLGCEKSQKFFQPYKTTKFIKGKLMTVEHLQNHIMQIKTGEGKSVILGVLSTILALMGHEVDTVCYSRYLSDRDYKDFSGIFKDLEVDTKISYGTFNQISQKFINSQCDVRNLAQNLFMPKQVQIKKKKKLSNGSKILLIDEVDTFFSRKFYGETYNPVSLIKSKQINQIIKLIWSNRATQPFQIDNLIKSSGAYKKIAEQYKDCLRRINNQFIMMINDVKQFNSLSYVVQDGKIGYKQHDGISFNSIYGYKTMFTYIYEGQPERGNVPVNNVENYMGISLHCGKYSYAEMIKGYNKIFGVTGTLQSLSQFQKDILLIYNITKKTFTPSVYGDSKRHQEPILIELNKDKYHLTIATQIKNILKQKGAVIVFFENQDKMIDFQKYHASISSDLMINVTEKTSDKDYYIKKATSSGSVTLFTAPFGRGTDFYVTDPYINKIGVSVIQTFLSQQLSEQIQIKGRTARQGNNGSYQLILNYQFLNAKYKITMDQINKVKQNPSDTLSKYFNRQRARYMDEVNKQRKKEIQRAKNFHQQSNKMKLQLQSKTIKRDSAIFFTRSGSRPGEKARILFMIDSTGSMDGTINQVKGKVMDMIDNLAQKYPNQFQIQLMFYYGINAYDSQKPSTNRKCHNNKLHRSQWTSNTQVLKKFMETVSADGGSYHEAVQLGLHHLLISHEEVGVTKGILIGDDGFDDKNQSTMAYHVHPDDRYRYTGRTGQNITEHLHVGAILMKLKNYGVSVDTYPINGGRTKTTFEHIASTTNGKSKDFSPKKDNLSEEIGATITECIVTKR